MKKTIITVYFGESSGGMFGRSYNTISLEPVNMEQTIDALIGKQSWVKVDTPTGAKYLNTNNILWFEVVDIDEEKPKNTGAEDILNSLFPDALRK